jgi:Effector-associated domain 1
VISSGHGPERKRFTKVGTDVERLAVGAETNLGDQLDSLELPPVLLDCLRPPFEQLGFVLGPEQLTRGAFPVALSYTLAKNGAAELALLNLPRIFYEATQLVVFAANGLGYAFGQSSRLHLFAEGRDAIPQYLETSMNAWNASGIAARFHPWMRVGELETAPDAKAFVSEMFALAALAGAGGEAASDLTLPEFNELHAALRSAFPHQDELAAMLTHKLDLELDDLAAPGKYPDRITDVIQGAKAGGWVRRLVEGALAANPGSPALRKFATDFGVDVPRPADG